MLNLRLFYRIEIKRLKAFFRGRRLRRDLDPVTAPDEQLETV